MTRGVGMDLIEIARIERALERRPRLADRVFTPDEQRYSAARSRPGRHLAARFAAKEAVVKALALGPETSLREIEVVPGTPPTLRPHGAVAAELAARGLIVHLSLTHNRETAGAVAIADEPSSADGASG
ncbi:MAG: holo-ACP synthase [Solirubrobacterales bacterium]|nr:holo-ACP synthase [Solirubrobacterales bacterium]